jgi:lysine-N-methylase
VYTALGQADREGVAFMAGNRIVLVPQYVRKFSCIGSDCEDTCCAGWRVEIDHKTYRKYQALKDPRLKPTMETALKRNKKKPSERSFGYLQMQGNVCPFLTQERMCRIQLLLGPDYLSDVCDTFPRMTNEINGVMEKSLTPACPEVARLALLNPDGIEFDEIEEPADTRNMVGASIDTSAKMYANKPVRWFWELRIFTIQTLQNRAYPLADRLIILGMFLQAAAEYVRTDRVGELPQLIASHTAIVADGSLRESLSKVPPSVLLQMKFVKEMADMRLAHSALGSVRFMECIRECLQGLQYTRDAGDEVIAERYRDAYQHFYAPFMESHEYILENYLVNHVYRFLFPLPRKTPDMYEEYVLLIAHYAMIKMILIGMSAHHQGLNTDLTVKAIQTFSRVVDHNPDYLTQLLHALRDSGHHTLPFMAILIRN